MHAIVGLLLDKYVFTRSPCVGLSRLWSVNLVVVSRACSGVSGDLSGINLCLNIVVGWG